MGKFDTACFLIAKNGYNSQTVLLVSETFAKSLDTVKARVEKYKKLLATDANDNNEKAEAAE